MEKRTLPSGGSIEAEVFSRWGDRIDCGPGVTIRAHTVSLGDDVRIGTEDDEFAFQFPGGTRVDVDTLTLGDRVRIGRQVRMRGGNFRIERDSRIGNNTRVIVTKCLSLGIHSSVNDNCEISGVDIAIGRDLWMLPTAKIGGGSAFDAASSLRAGDWLHLGMHSLVNTARPVVLGHEVGIGTGTGLYTHGAYPSALDGKPAGFGPITVGDRVWIPGAIVNPGVTIGDDAIVGVGSVVTRSIPAGAMAGGVPAKTIRENAYPRTLSGEERIRFIQEWMLAMLQSLGPEAEASYSAHEDVVEGCMEEAVLQYRPSRGRTSPESGRAITLADEDGEAPMPGQTIINLTGKTVRGVADEKSERVLNQLRRYGIRFRYEAVNGIYRPWE